MYSSIDKILETFNRINNALKEIEENFKNGSITENDYKREIDLKSQELINFYRSGLMHLGSYIKDKLGSEFTPYKQGVRYDSAFKKTEGMVRKTKEEFLSDFEKLKNLAEIRKNNSGLEEVDFNKIIEAMIILRDYYLPAMEGINALPPTPPVETKKEKKEVKEKPIEDENQPKEYKVFVKSNFSVYIFWVVSIIFVEGFELIKPKDGKLNQLPQIAIELWKKLLDAIMHTSINFINGIINVIEKFDLLKAYLLLLNGFVWEILIVIPIIYLLFKLVFKKPEKRRGTIIKKAYTFIVSYAVVTIAFSMIYSLALPYILKYYKLLETPLFYGLCGFVLVMKLVITIAVYNGYHKTYLGKLDTNTTIVNTANTDAVQNN